MKRGRRIGVSLGVLLASLSGVSVWLLVNVWVQEQVVIQEPRFGVLVFETIGIGLTGLFGLLGAIYFWRKGER